jgi:UDP-3-O-[3-hydroxymyristoyl] N-acetylglucosamine deacetylase
MSSSKHLWQQTLRRRVSLSGVGVHGGKPVGLVLCPADANAGITFLRIDAPEGRETEIPACAQAIAATELSTVLGHPTGICVATVEHLLAALSGLGIDNAVVEIDGPEVPVMDGSARAFVAAIAQAGTLIQRVPRRFIRILKSIRVELGPSRAEFRPHDGFRLEVDIDYDCPVIGSQALAFDVTPRAFRREIASARTFGYMKDVERLWAAGFALGSSLENSVVIGDGAVINPEGLRFPDEFVRHKALDAIGDLALAGAPIRGLYRSYRGGHKLNALAVTALLSERDAWTLESAGPDRESRPAEGHGELPTGMAATFAPETL